MMNWPEYGAKWPWHNLRYYPGIFLEGLRKSTKNPSQDNLCPNWYSNQPRPK